MKVIEKNTQIKKQAPPCDHLKDGERDWKFSEIFEEDYSIAEIKEIFNLNSYVYPDKEVFRKRVEEIFGIDVEDYITNYQVVTSHTEFPYMALKKQKIIVDLEKIDDIPAFYDYEAILKLNKMLFYNDIESTNWLKLKYPKGFTYLIKETGYTGSDDWLKFAFTQEDFSKWDSIDAYLFSYSCEKGNKAKRLRPKMLDKMISLGVELSQLSTVANMVSNGNQEMYEENKEELYAYLMAHCYKAGQSGIIEYLYDSNPKIIEVFRKKDFYGIEDLKDFTDNFYKPQNKRFGLSSLGPDPYISYGVINDPDGYTNLRHGKESSSKVIKRVKTGEKFGIETNKGTWWIVVTEDGSRGFMHRSRITIIKE
ncbi:hypothetical protein J2Q04_13340 [Tenacibaculum finnmarkense genomovar finnmarkense]|nr:SH3 domain-containing protein [Tenacibaculum finnmarkense]MCG8187053.1 hypothetical protein [Tenacibaculum finnmarkense genomovar finnmarkense]MCG8886626.1 SH3 domain-containing protein [Tenacibaculum finnmarkense]MCM8866291.1 hypothetical protein [Tenacibaculum finnmarkense genomovar finnmarkense]MCM8896906.1 hypothetical protein [Tenacibaculum finnmarkense genomovar finnmarkense]